MDSIYRSVATLIALAITGYATSATAESSQAQVIIHPVAAQSSTGKMLEFFPGWIVRVKEITTSQSLIESWDEPEASKYGAAWISSGNLAAISAFRPLYSWSGRKKHGGVAGDYDIEFDIKSDGTVRIEDSTHSLRGRLHKVGEVIWARPNKLAPEEFRYEGNHMFWLMPNGRLCLVEFERSCQD